MPEVCEIVMHTHYLITKLKNRQITNFKVLSGRYTKKPLSGLEFLSKKWKIKKIDSKGKFMWFELQSINNSDKLYLLNTFGLTGEWTFNKNINSRLKFTIENENNEKKYELYFNDQVNYGTLEITNDKSKLAEKLNKLAPDLLKTNYMEKDIKNRLAKIKNQNLEIIKVLMNQTTNSIGSGLGNYLGPEILYNANISPKRKISSLSDKDIRKLTNSIKYVLRLCYYNNKVGYMERFENYIEKHHTQISNGKFPNYHSDVQTGTAEFNFNVYRKKVDPLGNKVEKSNIIKTRTTYWVPSLQK